MQPRRSARLYLSKQATQALGYVRNTAALQDAIHLGRDGGRQALLEKVSYYGYGLPGLVW